MGRRRAHDEKTREALLAAAEALMGSGGIEAVSLRAVAERAGTTTRAVYSVFGSKQALVEGLALRALDLLVAHVDTVPLTDDPGADLVAAALDGFRPYALSHPDLFRLVLTGIPGVQLPVSMAEAATSSPSFQRLVLRVERARSAGLVGDRAAIAVALHWNALCLGLAAEELSCILPAERAEAAWRDALKAFLAGLGR